MGETFLFGNCVQHLQRTGHVHRIKTGRHQTGCHFLVNELPTPFVQFVESDTETDEFLR